MLKKLLYEPLLHFLVLGALLFLFYSLSRQDEDMQNSIVISKQRIEKLTSDLEEKFLRLLTAKEKQEIIDKETYLLVMYKEALKIGLDKSDFDIKGHLAQKMEFVTYDTHELPLPSDEMLKKFMLKYAKNYKEEVKISFTQSMIGGNEKLFKKKYTHITALEVEGVFGRAFSEALFNFNIEGKVHKIESEYGVHEVHILENPIPKLKAYDTIQEELQSDYLALQRESKNKTLYEALKSQYSISIEVK